MRIERVVWVCALLVAVLAGCGDLVVDLEPEEKDRLAAFVEDAGSGDDASDGGGVDIAPVPEVGTTLDLSGVTRLDHAYWDAIARTYVVDGSVRYSALAASPDAMELLDAYLGQLAVVDPSALADDSERLAFWINAYNALVVRSVALALAEDPTYRVDRDDFAFFKREVHTIAGAVYSLDQLEHGVVRGERTHGSVETLDDAAWAPYAAHHAQLFDGGTVDARIHVGFNCAARSCPPLPSFAFTGAELDAQLDARAEGFVQDPARGAGPSGISMLFFWFAPDFGASHGSSRGFIERYRADTSSVDFDTFLDYDWALNGE